jgi:hypothetical protein
MKHGRLAIVIVSTILLTASLSDPRRVVGQASNSPSRADGVQVIPGTVQSVEGELKQITFKTDDGRVLKVDVSRVDDATRRSLTAGQKINVIGRSYAPDRVTALDLDRGGATSSSARWLRIHGQVQSREGELKQVTLKTDDGKILKVDVSQVNPAVVAALTPGESVTVIAEPSGSQERVAARYIQQDSSAGAASPRR